MSLEQQADREELEAGLAGPFWQIYQAHVLDEWGDSGQRFILATKKAASQQDHEALEQLRQVWFAQEQILRLLRWPAERVS